MKWGSITVPTMNGPVHIAITRSIRKEHVVEFERLLGEFSRESMSDPGARGVLLLHPPPGSNSTEFGILRTFASAAERDAFYRSERYQQWLKMIAPLVEGEAQWRELSGLEAWFRNPYEAPPRWKMALVTWLAVWPVSVFVHALLDPLFPSAWPKVAVAAFVAAGIVLILTWVAMPLLVRMARPWLRR